MIDLRQHVRWLLALLAVAIVSSVTLAAPPQIPSLPWQQRSDWINVKTDVEPRAVGDGQADDTAAIQKAFSGVRDGSVLYFPPGTYRLTQPISVATPAARGGSAGS